MWVPNIGTNKVCQYLPKLKIHISFTYGWIPTKLHKFFLKCVCVCICVTALTLKRIWKVIKIVE